MSTDGIDLIMEPGHGKELSRSDMRLIAKAAKQRWPIPDEYKKGIVARMVQIAVDGQQSPRDSIGAARALVAMEGQNIDQEKIDAGIPEEEHNHVHLHAYQGVNEVELEPYVAIARKVISEDAGGVRPDGITESLDS